MKVASKPRKTAAKKATRKVTKPARKAANRKPAASTLEWSATLCDGKRVNHAAAEAACAALGKGWRLPSLAELESIRDITKFKPAIDTARFPDTKSDWYWTSTLYAAGPSYAWVVGFGDGYVGYGRRGYYGGAFVRAVRSVPSSQ